MKENNHHKRIRKLLEKEYAGFVLITCKLPEDNGNMEVEMIYEGDPVLASYLLEGAREYLDTEEEDAPMELLS